MNRFFLTVLLLYTAQSEAASMQPGLWNSSISFKLNGIQLPANESEGCVTAEQASDVKKTLTEGLKKDGCELTSWILKNTKLTASVLCKNKNIEATGTLHGKVTEKSYHLEGDAQGTYKNAIPSVATLKLIGKWVKKTCKK